MNQAQLANIIIAPWVTEKTGRLEALSCYVFVVAMCANKRQIAQAIQGLFGVKVRSVGTQIVKGTSKRTGQISGKTKAFKKAYVSLYDGQVIQLSKLPLKTK